ncbi:MAG: putative copper export protein/methionine-rich copper-binding protein CopC [Ilumatobacter sp.]|jgi:putative copper export protein/methionine-rich copper-binding protein CopC
MSAVAAAFAAVLIGLLTMLPGVAYAENQVVTSEPADGTTLATSPTQIVINFTEEIGELRIVSLECNTEPIALPAPTLSGNSRVMTVEIPEALPRGLCVATWRVSDSDGEPNGSSLISFTVDAEPAATTTPADGDSTTSIAESADGSAPAGSTPVSAVEGSAQTETIALNRVETGQGPLWLGRVLSTLGIAVVFGALVLIATAWPEGVEYLITVRFLRAAWVLALIGTVLFTSAAAAAVTASSLGSGFSPFAWFDLLGAGWAGRAAFFRLIFVIASAWVAFRPDRVNDPVTQAAALGVPALAVAMIGVGRVDGSLAALGVLLGIAHALAMAIWIGGVILLTRVVLAGPGDEDLVHAVRGFARVSIIAIIVTIATGLAQMLRLDGGDLFGSAHGLWTVFKVVLVAAMVFVGLSARQFAQKRLNRLHELSVPMAGRLRRAFGTEAAIGLVTLLASSWLLSLTPANVSAEAGVDYAISQTILVPEANLELTVKLTRNSVGNSGLEVTVNSPVEGLTGLEVMLTPPLNTVTGVIVQPVPLPGAGVATRSESVGLPIIVAGDWLLQINAQTAAGVVQSDPVLISILDENGAVPTTSITIPEPILVPIESNSTLAGS